MIEIKCQHWSKPDKGTHTGKCAIGKNGGQPFFQFCRECEFYKGELGLDGQFVNKGEYKPKPAIQDADKPAPNTNSRWTPAQLEKFHKAWKLLHTSKPGAGVIPQARNLIPCGTCKSHLDEYVSKHPPDMTSPDTWFKWTVALHNDVNKRTDKESLTVEQARKIWREHNDVNNRTIEESSIVGQRAASTTFDRCFFINLKRRPDRLKEFNAAVSNTDWPFPQPQRIDAIDGKLVKPPSWFTQGRGAWGVAMTHIRLLEQAINEGWESYLVFEDDARFCKDFGSRAKTFLASVPEDWDQIYLGGQNLSPPQKLNDQVLIPKNINRLHAFAVSKKFMLPLYRFLSGYKIWADDLRNKKKHHIDHRFGELHETGKYHIYTPHQWLVSQSSGFSDISEKHWDERSWPVQKKNIQSGENRSKRFLLTGHPRSGTAYMAKLCQAHDLDVRHEYMGADGISSWMMTAEGPNPPYGDNSSRLDFDFETIIHVVRNPIKTIASAVATENGKGGHSWKYRVKWAGDVEGNDYERAARMLLKWDEMTRSLNPAHTIRVEDAKTELPKILKLNTKNVTLPPENTNSRQHPDLSWEQLKEKITDKSLWNALIKYARQHKYKSPAPPSELELVCSKHKNASQCQRAMNQAKHKDAPKDMAEETCLLRRIKFEITRLRKRKRKDHEHTFAQLRSDVENNVEFIRKNVNSRWLVSILDTYADYGSDVESAAAMIVVSMINFERFNATANGKKQLTALWDGLKTVGTNPKTDAHKNMFRRISGVMATVPAIEPIYQNLVGKMLEQPESVFRKLDKKSNLSIVNDIRKSGNLSTNQPIYVSFYTSGTPYEQESEELKKTLDKFSLPYDIQPLPSRGSWIKNVNIKSEFMLAMRKKHQGRPIVWVDADARVKQFPRLFYELENIDIAFHRRGGTELLSGTLYCAPTRKANQVLSKWVEKCKAVPRRYDQKNLDDVVKSTKGLRVYDLPPTYTQIFDSMKNTGEPVILHTQANRRYRKIIKGQDS